jgi:hypothetical protein
MKKKSSKSVSVFCIVSVLLLSACATNEVIKNPERVIKENSSNVGQSAKLSKLEKQKKKCIKKGGEWHEPNGLVNNYHCVYYSGSTKLEVSEASVLELAIKRDPYGEKIMSSLKEGGGLISRIFGRKHPSRYRKRRCLKHGGAYIEFFDNDGNGTDRVCVGAT